MVKRALAEDVPSTWPPPRPLRRLAARLDWPALCCSTGVLAVYVSHALIHSSLTIITSAGELPRVLPFERSGADPVPPALLGREPLKEAVSSSAE